jgi:hypothetical protein
MKRIALLIATAVSVALPLTLAAAPASPASAYCSGSTEVWWSVGWGSEGASRGTCDGLKDYNGVLQDNALDGFDVRIRYNLLDGGGNHYSQWAVALNTNYWWGFWDTNSSSNGAACQSGGTCSSTWTNSGY